MRSLAARADTRLTYDDLVRFPDDRKRHEIIDGEHYVTPSPNVRHQVLVRKLLYELEHYFRSHRQTGLSKSTRKRDAQTKRRLFERAGGREYWLVDPELDTVQVFRPSPDGKLALVADLTSEDGDTLTTPLLPGCAINLRELFRDPA